MCRKLAALACAGALLASGIAAPAAVAGKKHHKGCNLVHKPPVCISLGL
jgi:hypothetical protein